MAISKITYKSSPSATPETWMDATGVTAAASDITSPKTAMLADGVVTTGTGSTPTGTKQISITENGMTTEDVAAYANAEITVNVQGGGGSIVDGTEILARNTDGYATSIRHYGSVVSREQYAGTIRTSWPTYQEFGSYITSFAFNAPIEVVYAGGFRDSKLSTFDFSHLMKVFNDAFSGTLLQEAVLPVIPFMGNKFARSVFANCKSLKRAQVSNYFTNYMDYFFQNCTALEEVQVGTIGNGFPGYAINNFANFFSGCTQTGLTITWYVDSGSAVDIAITTTRAKATNATIIVKAANALTYNDTAFAAGDTIATSTVEAS